MVETINNHQGFRIKGWLKPSLNEEGVTQMDFTLHVCFLQPEGDLTEFQKTLIYMGG